MSDILDDIGDVIVAWPAFQPPETLVPVRADLLTRAYTEIERLLALTGGVAPPTDKPTYRIYPTSFVLAGMPSMWMLRGIAEDRHPSGVEPGHFLRTSALLSVDFGAGIAITKNSIYKFES